MKNFTLRYGENRLYFGLNTIGKLKEHLNGIEHAIVVTGRRSAEQSGALRGVEKILKEFGIRYIIFNRVRPNPTIDLADQLAREAWKNSSDCIIAIGGGSVIDVSKISSVIAVNGGEAQDYLKKRVIKRKLKLFVVNLTHGTGSEVDRFAVITKGKEKVGISIRYPDVSFDDPRYTQSLPWDQAVYTSIDAFFHSYESVTARTTNPMVEALAINSAKIIGENVKEEQSIKEKYNLLYASMAAGIALDMSPAHIVHAIEHALSGINPKLAHGCGLGIVGARSIYWIHKRSKNSRKILEALVDKPIRSASDAERAFRDFLSRIRFEERLSDYSFGRDDFPEIKELVFGKLRYLIERSEVPFSEEMLLDILEKSL